MKTLSEYIESHPVKLSHQQWADRFGISRSYMTEILSGKKHPGQATVRKIAAATGGDVVLVIRPRASVEGAGQ